MSSDGSVTYWIDQLKAGDPAATEELWKRYFRRLVGLARVMLRDAPRRVADGEDVALSAFDSFFRAAEQGRFPRLHDRGNLWALLVQLTDRKAAHLLRDAQCQKRDGNIVPDASLHQVTDREPTPEEAAEVADECRRLLNLLGDPELQTVALWKMEGYTNQEIAAKLGCVVRSVERKVQLIRDLWESEVPHGHDDPGAGGETPRGQGV